MRLPKEFPEAWANSYGVDNYGCWMACQIWSEEIRFRYCVPGTFKMGSPPTEVERYDDEQLHTVTMTRGFWIAETACTQKLWHSVLGYRPALIKGDDLPVEQVSWDRIHEEFLPALNELVPGLDARLPSEAEWEYACRAGTQTPFSFGELLTTDKANYDGNYPYNNQSQGEYREVTVPVKTFESNPWGFYQMHGNVWEWCGDSPREYGSSTETDPWGGNGTERVLRGGSWDDDGLYLRSAARIAIPSGDAFNGFGFRLSRGPASGQAEPGGEDARGTRADEGFELSSSVTPSDRKPE